MERIVYLDVCVEERCLYSQVTIIVDNVIGAACEFYKELTPAGAFNCAIRVSRRLAYSLSGTQPR